MSSSSGIQVNFTDRFWKDIRRLAKRYRVKNSDVQKGKSGGYRVLYYLKTETQILLITIYSKSDRSDMDAAEICQLLNDAEDR